MSSRPTGAERSYLKGGKGPELFLACIKPWVPFPALYKLGMVAHACSPSSQEVETEKSEVQGHWAFKMAKVVAAKLDVQSPYLTCQEKMDPQKLSSEPPKVVL